MLLKDQVVLITGASSGIGRAAAEQMAAEGASVAVNYLKNHAGALAAVEAIRKKGGKAIALQADVTKAPEVARLEKAVRDEWRRIDILVNNAGDLFARTMLREMTEEYCDRIMDLNLKSVFLATKAVADEMVARTSGIIINITSIAGRNGGGPGTSAYAAAKGGVLIFTKAMAKELGPHGVRVNAVAPGVILTPYHEKYSTPETLETFRSRTPIGRNGTSEEAAGVIVFLASPASSFMLGETVR